jgi:response regulator NasT
MTAGLRIVVADDEQDMRDYFARVLPRLGHQVVGIASTGRELVELCRTLQPDLVITDVKMPELDGIEAATEIYRIHPVPVLLVSAYHDDSLIARAAADHILGYLVKPIKQTDLPPAITLAWQRFQDMEKLKSEAHHPNS